MDITFIVWTLSAKQRNGDTSNQFHFDFPHGYFICSHHLQQKGGGSEQIPRIIYIDRCSSIGLPHWCTILGMYVNYLLLHQEYYGKKTPVAEEGSSSTAKKNLYLARLGQPKKNHTGGATAHDIVYRQSATSSPMLVPLRCRH